MKLIILYIFIVATLNTACGGGSAEEAASLSGTSASLESANSSWESDGDLYASTISTLNKIYHSAEESERKGLYIIGKAALSQMLKNLEIMSKEGQKLEPKKVLIKSYDHNDQSPQPLWGIKPGMDNNFTHPAGEYLEPASFSLPFPPTIEPSGDIVESSLGGMTAIWKP